MFTDLSRVDGGEREEDEEKPDIWTSNCPFQASQLPQSRGLSEWASGSLLQHSSSPFHPSQDCLPSAAPLLSSFLVASAPPSMCSLLAHLFDKLFLCFLSVSHHRILWWWRNTKVNTAQPLPPNFQEHEEGHDMHTHTHIHKIPRILEMSRLNHAKC